MPDLRYRDPEYAKHWREAHPERVKEHRRKYYQANREKHLAAQKARYEANIEQRRARQRDYNRTHREVINNRLRERKYGISPDDYAALYRFQGGECRICLRVWSRRLHVDHSHATGRIRGLLCDDCNLGLGKFADDPARLKRALDYLEAA
jgi:Autographiviridae endonuclease VII